MICIIEFNVEFNISADVDLTVTCNLPYLPYVSYDSTLLPTVRLRYGSLQETSDPLSTARTTS